MCSFLLPYFFSLLLQNYFLPSPLPSPPPLPSPLLPSPPLSSPPPLPSPPLPSPPLPSPPALRRSWCCRVSWRWREHAAALAPRRPSPWSARHDCQRPRCESSLLVCVGFHAYELYGGKVALPPLPPSLLGLSSLSLSQKLIT